MALHSDGRRRNVRPSTYRPRTEAQKQRRKALRDARAEARAARQAIDAEADLRGRLGTVEAALRDFGMAGVHNRRHARPLEDIVDDAERLAVLKARVERLEALWSLNHRKRETRGKILIGAALLAEFADAGVGDAALRQTLIAVLDRLLETVRDRLTVTALLGDASLPVRRGGRPGSGQADLSDVFDEAPEIELMVQSALAQEAFLGPAEIDPVASEGDLKARPSR